MKVGTSLGLRFALIATFSVFVSIASAALPAPDPDDGGLTLPPGFRALVVADKLGPIRYITVGPNGDIYTKKTVRGLIALHDSTGNGRTDVQKSFGDEFGSGTGVSLRNGWLYFSTDDAVYRYKMNPGELVPSGAAEPVIVGMPPGQRQHESKAFEFDDSGHLYVEVGCPSNASGNPDRAPGAKGQDPAGLFVQHGGFWRFDANKTNQDQLKDGFHFSTGMRHSVSVAWNPISKSLFVTMMGRDQLNTVDSADYTAEDSAESPAEEFHILKEGSNFGWPYTYWNPIKKVRMLAPEFGGDNKKTDTSGKYPDPYVALPAHWAFLQMAFSSGTQFPEKYRNGMFIASHGSWNRAPLPQAGYKIVYLPFDKTGMPVGNFEVFADNFAGIPVIPSPNDAIYRPGGCAVGPDGSLFVSDTEKGRVWRIIYTGETKALAQNPMMTNQVAPTTTFPAELMNSPGGRLYTMACMACHMADGGGVANMQPSLKASKVLPGDATKVIRILLEGPDKVLPADRAKYSNKMPQMNVLTDEQIATVLTFVREQFGGKASAITPEQVAAVRKQVSP